MGEGAATAQHSSSDPLLLHVALLLFGLLAAALRLKRRPSMADPFFTWDGGSGEYAFVHQAVELPKYSDVSEEMLMYSRSEVAASSQGGFLETIAEEDEASWGSWDDESDEDRMTVVEMDYRGDDDDTKDIITHEVSAVSNDVDDEGNLDALWITPDALESPDSLDPWAACEFKPPSDDLTSLDFTVNIARESDKSLLDVNLDGLCLVPSSSSTTKTESEELMFSDNFKDYFLPASDHSFDKEVVMVDATTTTPDILSNTPDQKGLRCFRIGFEPAPTEQVALVVETPHQKSDDDCREEPLLFSPADGDVAYGSAWPTGGPEKGAEVHCSPADNNRHSDDDVAADEVPKSLSRWQHHADLQHVQEATSPVDRWQHHERGGGPERADSAEEESDDGLPPQLKEIYSSFKMRDNKMGRIRIKEDKNNNFKRLGLWDSESKVTLPPFKTSTSEPTNNNAKPNENSGGSREDLDDLEFDMFTTQKKTKTNSDNNNKPSPNCDSDIDDALKSFDLLDDYSSMSDNDSEPDNKQPINAIDLENALSAIAQCSERADNTISDPNIEAGPSSLESPPDDCPLCCDSNDHPGSFPKMKTLAPNSDDSEQNSLTKASDSPLTTTSDSDEGVRVKEVKKRTRKQRPKDTTEMKHDDSGYVEDDEDDDEEEDAVSLEEHADDKTTRKSISAAYYESKSSSKTPCTYREFSEQLEQSLGDEGGTEKWQVPENLSQFSAWLLDKELMKINKRDEVERMMMDDIVKLREQTIADFLKNTSSAEQKIILNSTGLTTSRQILETIEEIESRGCRKDKTDTRDDCVDPFVLKPQPIAYDISDYNDPIKEGNVNDNTQSSDDSSDKSDSDKGALTEEYYSYNVNSHVSKMFTEPHRDETVFDNTASITIENKGRETHAIGNAEAPRAVHHPPPETALEPETETSIGPASSPEILPKVKDTTILLPTEAPSDVAAPIEDDDSTREVASSSEERGNYSDSGEDETRVDLMTPGAREGEEENEREEAAAECVETPEGVASSLHVLSPHAHCMHTALNGISSDAASEKVNSEEADCCDTSPAEFTIVYCDSVAAYDAGDVCGIDSLSLGGFGKEESSLEPLESGVERSISDGDVKSSQIPDSEVEPSLLPDGDVTDKPVGLKTEHSSTAKRVSRAAGNFFGPIDCVNAPLVVPSGILSTTLEDLTQIAKPDLIADCSESPVLRGEYKRSNSLGREPEEPFEPLTAQSKSTPDLRRCQLNSSAPLSALLSKSVSQRIHDYLGRPDRLNRSLPPSERSRHYRRICVSTETVGERAAKFEARSKSTPEANPFAGKRSGSCPPNMRNHRLYNKPTAVVKPTTEISQMEMITGFERASKVTHKPPVHPSPAPSLKSCRLKGKIASARRDFFERLSKSELAKSAVEVNAEVDEDDLEEPGGLNRFTAFRKSAREERARLAASHPDLGALEAAVRTSRRKIDQLKKQQQENPSVGPMPSTKGLPYRRCTGEIAWASCAERLRSARAQRAHVEIVDVRAQPAAAEGGGGEFLGSRARSMDFLLDADNRERAQPPENRLAAAGGQTRVKSEHELRIERSLQNLTLPDWYKQAAKPKEGFILRRGSEGSAGESRKRWQGLGSSRTPSTTSLTSYSQRSIAVPKRVTVTPGDWRGSLVSSRESLTPASPASLSPRECSSAAFQYGLSSTSLSRWSSSRLSTSSAPLTALSVHRSFRQPYLGWRAAAASSSGGASPGTSPLNATTPVQGGSRPGSPRRGSQEQHFGYGLQQNQITSAATLRPDGGSEAPDVNRISPLALNTTNVFFNSNDPPPAAPTPMRRDRYSYTQSLYSGAPLSPDDDDHTNSNNDGPPRVWMESSFVGSRKDGAADPPPPRSIRIVPSTTVAPSRAGTCATAMDTRELIDHLHNFLRGLQNRNQTIRASSAFTPVPSSSNSGFHQNNNNTDEDDGSHSASTGVSHHRHSLVEYDSEPRAYPRRHSSGSSKDISPDNSSTDNELWLSVGDDPQQQQLQRGTTTPLDGSSRSSVSPPSPQSRFPKQPQKRVSEDSTGRPIFFASSRRGSKGSDSKGEPPVLLSPQQQQQEDSRKSSSTHSEESGFNLRDSSNSWRDSSSASKGERESSASMEEVLESLLAIPPTNSRSSSPTSPRRSKGPNFAPPQQRLHEVLHHRNDEQDPEPLTRTPEVIHQPSVEEAADQGKMFADSLSFPQPFPSSSTSTAKPLCSPLEEVNHGSFCRSSSASPLEDDVQSPTSMEVLVPEGEEEQELSSIVEDEAGEEKRCRPPLQRQATLPSCSSSGAVEPPRSLEDAANLFAGLQPGSYFQQPLRRPQSLCLVLLHLPCMFCPLDPPPPRAMSEPGTPSEPCCGQPLASPTLPPSAGQHLKCQRPKCGRSLPQPARTCPNCYAAYCSRQCRKMHAERHSCPQTRLANLCKQVLLKAREDPASRRHLSLCARRGLLSRGRGAVKLLFPRAEDAQQYVARGWEGGGGQQTLYVARADLLPQEMGADVFGQVRSFCDRYNPERKFILLAAVGTVVRGAKLHLAPADPEDDVQTLILTLSKEGGSTADDRRRGLAAVAAQLRARGVDLEALYPHTYRKMLKFVADGEPFAPISIFPTDQRTGRVFMCIVLPWADPDIIVNISSKGKASKKKWIS